MKFLIVGLGSIGKRHVRNLGEVCPGSEIFAYREGNLPLGEFEDKYKITTFQNLNKALSQGYDAVFITNPTSRHIYIALRAASKGNNIFIEKPVSHNMRGIDKLQEIVKKNDLITFVGFNMRFHPAIKKMKQFLTEKRMGKPYFARLQVGEYLPGWHPYEDYSSGYSACKELGGGALLTLSHEVDYLLWLKNNPQFVCSMSSRVSNLKINVEDNVEMLLKYKDGFIAEININYLQRDHSRNCQIIGEKGALEWDYYKNILTFYDNETGKKNIIWNDMTFERNNMYREEVKHFIDCIIGNKKPLIDLREGLKSLKVILSAKKSDKEYRFFKLRW